MQIEFRADLHIHTCLSPCAELSMTPLGIVERAASLGLHLIAVSDHNSAENVTAAYNLASGREISLIPGLEITSLEDVHILALFGNVESAMEMQSVVYENLQPGENDEESCGMQVIVNEHNEVMGFNRRLLIGSTFLSLGKLVELIHGLGGIAIASHVDREGYGIIGQLGFIPVDLAIDAVEFSPGVGPEEARLHYSAYSHIPWVFSSDAHRIEDIGKKYTRLLMKNPSFEELRLALRGTGGRKIIC
jgi:PHP family Zn ribbon phosphoesterase